MMNILYITSLFHKQGSSASIRNVSLVNGLASEGHSVSVLTIQYPTQMLDQYLIKNTHPAVIIHEVYSGLISKYVPNVKQDSVKLSFGRKVQNKIKKMIKNIFMFPDVDKGWIAASQNYDVTNFDLIISSSDTKTSHFIANDCKKKSDLPWVQIWGDPWFKDIGNVGLLKKYRSKFAEKKLLESADYVFYVSKPTLSEMSALFPKSNMGHIPRGFLKEVPKTKEENDCIKMVYTGVLGGRNLRPIVESIHHFNMQSKKKLELDIYGRIEPQLISDFGHEECLNFLGQVDMEKIIEVYSEADILLFIGNAGQSSQIPGKLYDYFGTECKILALLESMESDVAEFIVSTQRCTVFENKVSKINLANLVGSIGEDTILEEYSPSSIAKTFLNKVNQYS